ncbi:MAG: arylsulfotransferase family protein [Actinomycetota bacterium]|nr:arylsulfotransferase family protein [Actinomycetota bacterium]
MSAPEGHRRGFGLRDELEPAAPSGLTRGQFIRAAGGGAGWLAFAGPAYGATRRHTHRVPRAAVRPVTAGSHRVLSFNSRPDLHPPAVKAYGGARAHAAVAEGYSFLGPASGGGAQAGALIVDAAGDPAWFHPVAAGKWVSNFRAQRYRGEPVLTWWEGTVIAPGYGKGVGVIVDSSYREVARVRAANGRHIDLHEFVLTPQGTALFTCFPQTVPADLSGLGGARDGRVLESIIQEVDVHTGRLLLEWRSTDHVPASESYLQLGGVYDYLHANSIGIARDGRLLVSARHTSTLYKLERRTGRVIWRMGGKRSDFAMGKGTRFAWQHDARQVGTGMISLFDDGAGPQKTESHSRGLVLQFDAARRSVRHVRSYHHPNPLLASAMGNMQVLPDGNVIVEWGNVPVLSEFAADGRLLGDLRFPWANASYRGYRFPWSGTPAGVPAIAATVDAATNRSTLYVSWNGATGVSAWQVSLGSSAGALRPVGVARRDGFETAIPLRTAVGYVAATALDASGQSLASSDPIKL